MAGLDAVLAELSSSYTDEDSFSLAFSRRVRGESRIAAALALAGGRYDSAARGERGWLRALGRCVWHRLQHPAAAADAASSAKRRISDEAPPEKQQRTGAADAEAVLVKREGESEDEAVPLDLEPAQMMLAAALYNGAIDKLRIPTLDNAFYAALAELERSRKPRSFTVFVASATAAAPAASHAEPERPLELTRLSIEIPPLTEQERKTTIDCLLRQTTSTGLSFGDILRDAMAHKSTRQLIALVGKSGCGKTTTIFELAKEGYVVVYLDCGNRESFGRMADFVNSTYQKLSRKYKWNSSSRPEDAFAKAGMLQDDLRHATHTYLGRVILASGRAVLSTIEAKLEQIQCSGEKLQQALEAVATQVESVTGAQVVIAIDEAQKAARELLPGKVVSQELSASPAEWDAAKQMWHASATGGFLTVMCNTLKNMRFVTVVAGTSLSIVAFDHAVSAMAKQGYQPSIIGKAQRLLKAISDVEQHGVQLITGELQGLIKGSSTTVDSTGQGFRVATEGRAWTQHCNPGSSPEVHVGPVSEAPAPAAALASTREERHELLGKNLTGLFSNLSAYLTAELGVTKGDFALLEELNKAAEDKYFWMADNATRLADFLTSVHENYKEIEPFLARIDEIDRGVTELEQTVAALDDYTKRLEGKFKKLSRTLR
eukprot:m51a1_g2298 putative biogenesis of lysosome-related organelles complex 1 subunit 2 (660) ;mRNA; r:423345-431639